MVQMTKLWNEEQRLQFDPQGNTVSLRLSQTMHLTSQHSRVA